MGETNKQQSGKNEKIIAAAKKRRLTIEKRQKRKKERLLESLRKIPVVEAACRNAEVARANYYRWLNEDQNFAGCAEQALREVVDLVSDKAESNIISKINVGDIATSKYWLDNHKKEYKKPRAPQNTDHKIKTLIVDF